MASPHFHSMEKINRIAIGFVLAWSVSLSHSGFAGIFWKTVPVEGPLVPNVGLVLAASSRAGGLKLPGPDVSPAVT